MGKDDACSNEVKASFSIHESLSSSTGSIGHDNTISSGSSLLDCYDGFLLDQFGVMHDGVTALPGAVECITALHGRNKKLIILSNTSSLAEPTMQKLPKLGFANPKCFVGAVTSGQEAAAHVRQNFGGKKAVWFTWKLPKEPSPMLFLQACGDITPTTSVEDADFLLLHGCEVLRGPGNDDDDTLEQVSLGDYFETENMFVIDPILKLAAERRLPMVCANPDYIYVSSGGTIRHMPGKILERYQQLLKEVTDGDVASEAQNESVHEAAADTRAPSVTSFGKPHAEHFEACLRQLNLPKDRVVHVGDSLHHDIAGANAAGMRSILVTGGVHRKELEDLQGEPLPLGQLPEVEALQALFDRHGQTPTHVVPLLR